MLARRLMGDGQPETTHSCSDKRATAPSGLESRRIARFDLRDYARSYILTLSLGLG